MNSHLIAIALAAASLSAVGGMQAQAADMPRRAAQPTFQAAVPTFTWTGFYLGANAGAVWGDFTKSAGLIRSRSGFTGGVTAGYNHQVNQLVFGLEGDYNYSGLKGSGVTLPGFVTASAHLKSFGTLRGRVGVAFDRAMVYGTGGYAFGVSAIAAGPALQTTTHHGYAVGGGLEYAFTQNVSAKAEYLYMPFQAKNAGNLPGVGFGGKAGVDASVVRGGVNYRF
jgi:outer membrane immunogenic protein